MAQLQKVSTQVDIKSNPDMFYKTMMNNLSNLPQLLPDIIKNVKFLDTNLVYFEYVINGNTMKLNEVVEANESSRSLKFIVVEGDVLKEYTSLKFQVQVQSGYVEITTEFEKVNEDLPIPRAYIDMVSSALKKVDVL